MVERTCAIIKPHAVRAGFSGPIIEVIERNKFVIAHMQKIQFTQAQAEEFYGIHRERPFFGELVGNMLSGPVIIMALEKESAIQDWRTLMGATNPASAAVGTIRCMFGVSISENVVHGSDAAETAQKELKQLFGTV